MKIHLEIDCTPEEARRFMGLPDVGKANDVYVDMMASAMKGVKSPDQLRDYAQQLAPMGQFGLKMFQSFMEGARAGRPEERVEDGSPSGRGGDTGPA